MTEQEIIKKIQEAVPGIVELKRGCVIETKNITTILKKEKMQRYEIIGQYEHEENGYSVVFERGKIEQREKIQIDDDKIIGRDITPIDILKTRTDLTIDGLGGVFERLSCDKEGKLWRMIYRGHYEIDTPYHLQSKETKEFIGNLLK